MYLPDSIRPITVVIRYIAMQAFNVNSFLLLESKYRAKHDLLLCAPPLYILSILIMNIWSLIVHSKPS